MAKSPEEATETMIQNLKEKTGKDLAAWQAVVARSGAARHSEIVTYLKTQFGVTHGYANLIAHKSLGSDAGSADEGLLLAAQYAGEKAGLRPIYDLLIKKVQAFGADIELAPKKGYVSVRRSKQFALVQPSTKTRLDVGIQLKGVPPTDRLEKSGSFNAMVSHRVRLESVKEVDSQLLAWLKQAYDAA